MRPAERSHDPATRPAIFVDKDGTLVVDVPCNVDAELIRFMPHALEGLRLLASTGLPLFVVTNQPGLATGRITRKAFVQLQQAIEQRLSREAGVTLAGWYTCPHAETAGCLCRKPASGLLRQAALANGLDLGRSWMIGDILDDIEAGRRVGCRTILVDVGNETVWRRSPLREPHHTSPDLVAAAEFLIEQTGL